MNLQEEIEKAFIAGAEYMKKEASWNVDEFIDMPSESELNKAITDYINGNRESS